MPTRNKPRHYKPDSERKTVVISLRVTAGLQDLVVRAAKSKKIYPHQYWRDAAEKMAKKDLGE